MPFERTDEIKESQIHPSHDLGKPIKDTLADLFAPIKTPVDSISRMCGDCGAEVHQVGTRFFTYMVITEECRSWEV